MKWGVVRIPPSGIQKARQRLCSALKKPGPQDQVRETDTAERISHNVSATIMPIFITDAATRVQFQIIPDGIF